MDPTRPLPTRCSLALCLAASVCALIVPTLVGAQDSGENAGTLDQPVVVIDDTAPGVQPIAGDDVLVLDEEELETRVDDEIEELEELPISEVEERAESGERAAQVVLGNDFAREAAMLGFAPAAANDALADAARWYAAAASRGFPGAPSLDLAGVRFFPIRIQREP